MVQDVYSELKREMCRSLYTFDEGAVCGAMGYAPALFLDMLLLCCSSGYAMSPEMPIARAVDVFRSCLYKFVS